jgi:CDP-diacylglycerol--glycerol-3-phosphate 3-phosphatidyltransferase
MAIAKSRRYEQKPQVCKRLFARTMNLPNQLTLSRFGLTGVFVAAMSLGWHNSVGHAGWRWDFGFRAALFIFLLAVITDYADGVLARKRNQITNFGKLMDPLADKVLMAAALICLVELGAAAVPAWAVILIVSRELAVTGLRLLAANQGIVLPAESLGKHKTAWQAITIGYLLSLLALWEHERGGGITGLYWWAYAFDFGGWILMTVTLLLTTLSGIGYFWRNRWLLSESPTPPPVTRPGDPQS